MCVFLGMQRPLWEELNFQCSKTVCSWQGDVYYEESNYTQKHSYKPVLQMIPLHVCFPLHYRFLKGQHHTYYMYICDKMYCCGSVARSCPTLWPYGLQHARLPCHSLSPRVCSDLCPLSPWCHQTFSFYVTSFSFCPQSSPVSRSFPMSQLFTSCSQSIGASASASVFLMNVQGWFPLGLIGLISLLSKDLSRVFFSTAIQKH